MRTVWRVIQLASAAYFLGTEIYCAVASYARWPLSPGTVWSAAAITFLLAAVFMTTETE